MYGTWFLPVLGLEGLNEALKGGNAATARTKR